MLLLSNVCLSFNLNCFSHAVGNRAYLHVCLTLLLRFIVFWVVFYNNINNNSHIYYTHKFAKCLLSDTAACGRNSWQWHKHSCTNKEKNYNRSSNASLNRLVFNPALKVSSEGASLSAGGRAFHTAGTATPKERLANYTCTVPKW